MVGYLLMLVFHTAIMCGIAWWYLRAYRKAAERSRREVERMVAGSKSATIEAEIDYLRKRQEILLHGLYPEGTITLEEFVAEDPELQAYCELLDVFRHAAPQEHKPVA